jgi:hypothetical protein
MPKKFSQQIRAAVDASEHSRYRIAKMLGISQNAMSVFMRGGWLAQDTANALAALLGLEVTTKKQTTKGK